MPKIVDHDSRREHLLEGAHRLFVDRGYHDVSMRLLARELQVSTGTLYHYFPGKEALFEALVRSRASSDVAAATEGLPPGASPALRLQRLSAFVLHHHLRLRETLVLVLEYERGKEHPTDFVRASLAAYRSPLIAALGPEAGELGLSLILGMLIQQLLEGERGAVEAHLAGLGRLS